ncbi:MAG: class I SAM-dependent methyltransferase [Spirosomataceae bacterium]
MSERFKPIRHNAPNSLWSKVLFGVRLLVDFQFLTIYSLLRQQIPQFKGKVLDIGCGNSPFKHLVDSSKAEYIGIDVEEAKYFDYANPDVIYFNGENLPFADNSIDHFICTEVIEHIPDPTKLISEMRRVLAPTGSGIVTLPWSARFHFAPYDYHRYTPSMLALIFREFSSAVITNRGTDINAIVSKIIVFYVGHGLNWRPYWLAPIKFILLIVFLPIIVMLVAWAHMARWLNWGSTDDPLGYTIMVKK